MNFNTFLLGMLICFLLSFMLGVERQIRRRFVGLRTMILVAVGSYLFVSFSFLITGYSVDITRIASQVVAGIGFLGAGVIIKDNAKNKIRGLTTAATLWCDASIGILCAGGFIKEAIAASVVVLFSNSVLRYINYFINNKIDEKHTNEVFSVKFVSKNINKIVDYVVAYSFNDSNIIINNYNVINDEVMFEITVNKINESCINSFINRVVDEYNIKGYQYNKLSEFKVDNDIDEL